MTSLVPHNTQSTFNIAAAYSGFSSFALFLPFPGPDDAVLHGLVQTVLSYLRNHFRRAFSSLRQDRKNLQNFTLHEHLGQTLLHLHHVQNYDHRTVTQVGYFTEQQRLNNLQPVGRLRREDNKEKNESLLYVAVLR